MKFGYAPWLPETEPVSKFTEALGDNRLMGTQCRKCKQRYLPPRAHCKCGSTELEWFDAPNRGKIRTYTVVSATTESMSKYAPYIVGIVDFEKDMSLIGQLTGVTRSTLKVGLSVRLVARKLDTDHIVYEFGPP